MTSLFEIAGGGTGINTIYGQGIRRGAVNNILPNLRVQVSRNILKDGPDIWPFHARYPAIYQI